MSKPRTVEIIAHRGASYDAPENTMASVQLAWEQGADAVEVDCRMSRDERIVVIHDPDTKRTAGAHISVGSATFDDLQQLDVGSWKGRAWRNERIPALESVIDTLPRRKRLFVEVKCGQEINESLVDVLTKSEQSPAAFAVISYDLAVVQGVKHAMPGIAAYLVARFEHDETTNRWSPTVDELVATAMSAGLDGIDIQARSYVNANFVAAASDVSLETYVWTVDNPTDAQRLIDAGVRGIATNRPDWLRTQLGLDPFRSQPH